MTRQTTPARIDQIGRREYARVRLTLPGDLLLLDGKKRCRLKDLSITGASVALDPLPRTGESGFLRFAGHEVFARIVWARNGHCGLEFDQPLPLATVVAMRQRSQDLPQIERSLHKQAASDWVNGHVRILT